jgi:Transposase DDE domain
MQQPLGEEDLRAAQDLPVARFARTASERLFQRFARPEGKPLRHLRSALGAPCMTQQLFPLFARRQAPCIVAILPHLLRQTVLKRHRLTNSAAVGIPRHLKVYPANVQMIWPVAKRGRPRQRHVPDILSIPAEDMLANAQWHTISWRTGTKGKLKARFAAVRVRVADGPPQRIRDKGQQHLPGDEAWLIGEHRMSGEKKYYLANLPAKTDLRTLAATIKARWICEQAHQQLKEELGLDHFEGRSWHGRHRHALMTMIAYAFLQHRRLKTARREKKNQRAATATNLASGASGHPRTHHSTTTAPMPALSKMDLQRAAA